MPAGLQEEIDELDHLLDKLLKLPIESARPAPRTITLKPVTLAVVNDVEAEVEEDSDPQTPILRFDGKTVEEVKDEEFQDSSILFAEPPVEAPITPVIDSSTTPVSALTSSPSPEVPAEGSLKLPADEIPWIDDEPPAHTPGSGPQIEIIHGPTSQMIVANSAVESTQARPFATRRSWLYWILWTWTWLFDHTFGHWFPWLRRPGVKFVLGLIGVALSAVSLYLAWIGWRR